MAQPGWLWLELSCSLASALPPAECAGCSGRGAGCGARAVCTQHSAYSWGGSETKRSKHEQAAHEQAFSQ